MKIIYKLLIYITLLAISYWLSANSVFAANLTVTCDNSDCVMSPASGAALWQELDIKPGDNLSRQITVINNGSDVCHLYLDTKNETDPKNFGNVLFTAINDGTTDWFGQRTGNEATSLKNFTDLFNAGSIYLGTIPIGGSSKIYDWLLTISKSVGNEYQQDRLDFDFDLHFECGLPPPCPDLAITKTNDKKDAHVPLGVGNVVYYTVTVKNNSGFGATNVRVEDVQPVQSYFDYDEHSGKLTDPLNNKTNISADGTNPFFWQIGDIGPGETYKLTYDLKILSVVIPGTHYNIAVAISDNGAGGSCFSQPVLDPFDVGTPGVTGSYGGEVKSEQTGTVLGAATKIGQVLGAATGNPTAWLILAIGMIVLGSSIKLYRKLKN